MLVICIISRRTRAYTPFELYLYPPLEGKFRLLVQFASIPFETPRRERKADRLKTRIQSFLDTWRSDREKSTSLHALRSESAKRNAHRRIVNYDDADFSRKVILPITFHVDADRSRIARGVCIRCDSTNRSVSALATSCANNSNVYPTKGYNQFFEEAPRLSSLPSLFLLAPPFVRPFYSQWTFAWNQASRRFAENIWDGQLVRGSVSRPCIYRASCRIVLLVIAR